MVLVVKMLILRVFPTYAELIANDFAHPCNYFSVRLFLYKIDIFQDVLRIGCREQVRSYPIVAKTVLHCEFFDRITD